MAIAACDDTGTGSGDTRQVTLGGLFSITGNWSSLGVTSRAAMELAIEDVNAYAAGRGVEFRADIRDTKLEPATALAAAQALREAGVQVVIGPQSSAELATLKPYVDANALLVVSQSSTAGTLAVSGDRIYRFTPADSLEGLAVSSLIRADGVRALVPVWRADAGNQGLHRATAARFQALGGAVSSGIEYSATTTDFTATVASLRAQVTAARQTHGERGVAVYLAGFDEVAELFALAAADPLLSAVPWYGSDGVAQSAVLLAKPAAAAFAAKVGFPSPIFGLDPAASEKWSPLAERIRAKSGTAPDAFSLAVYDAVWVAAQAYLASPPGVGVDELRAKFATAAGSFYGATGWTTLNAAGDRQHGNFDFWAIRPAGAAYQWRLVASYDTRAGTLARP